MTEHKVFIEVWHYCDQCGGPWMPDEEVPRHVAGCRFDVQEHQGYQCSNCLKWGVNMLAMPHSKNAARILERPEWTCEYVPRRDVNE